MKKKLAIKNLGTDVLGDIRQLIESARGRVATYANAELTMLYWRIGARIRREILKSQRAEYGEEILPTLSAKLTPDYGEGFGKRNLLRMIKFAGAFTDERIVSTLSTQLSWSHFLEIIPISDKQIELLELSQSGIRVVEYMTELMPKALLEKKFHEAIKLARLKLENRTKEN